MYIKVHVTPQSVPVSLEKIGPDTFTVAVREAARGGAANTRVLALLRQHFRGTKRLYIVSGHHSPHKIISVE